MLIDKDAPLSNAFQGLGMTWAAAIIAAGSVSTLTSTTFASLLGQPRIFYQMAVDVRSASPPFASSPFSARKLTSRMQGLLPPFFKKLNKRQVPVYGTIITGMVAG